MKFQLPAKKQIVVSPKADQLPAKKQIAVPQQNPERSERPKADGVIPFTGEQLSAIALFRNKKSCCLIGKAGTGKTTTAVEGIISLIDSSPDFPRMQHSTKTMQVGQASVVVLSFTNKAVNNLKYRLPVRFQSHCYTIHKFLEYAPTYITKTNQETGEEKDIRIFMATRTAVHPIPDIRYIILEESSTISVELHAELVAACPNATFIYLGDLNQLKPVFGDPILGYKLNEIPLVELTQVHRQALENPGTRLLLRILEGKPMPRAELEAFSRNSGGAVDIKIWPKKGILPEQLMPVLGREIIPKYIESGKFDPEEDQIIIPYGKAFGSNELNKYIAEYLQRKRGTSTYEIIAGWRKEYLSPGDKIVYNKQEGKILSISLNPKYVGYFPRSPSPDLDRWGRLNGAEEALDIDLLNDLAMTGLTDFDAGSLKNAAAFMATKSSSSEETETTQQLSHLIEVQTEDGIDILSTVGSLNSLLLGYAITVHKAMGSEWRKVWLILHSSHGTLLSRELLYTAVSRFREELIVFCEEDSFTKGIARQLIPGNTIAEKAAYFRSKAGAEALD